MPAFKKRRGFTLINRGTIKAHRSGFTLIELMIAISIIAIISSVGLVTYSQSQKLGRDAKRKQDLRAIAIALELYYQRYKHYPCASTWVNSTASNPWIVNNPNATGANNGCGDTGNPTADPFNSNFINSLPRDPLNTSSSSYVYWSRGDNYAGPPACSTVTGQAYYLYTLLENSSDPDAHLTKQYKFCNTVFNSTILGFNPNNYFFVTSE